MPKQLENKKPLAATFFKNDGKYGEYFRSATLTAENFDELQKAEIGGKLVLSPTREGSKAAFTLRIISKEEVDGWKEKYNKSKKDEDSNGLD